MAISRIDELLNPTFLDGLDTLDLAEVRRRRDDCQEASDTLSYLRRMVQGRLDIVQAEQQRRLDGGTGELADLVDHLPEILSDRVRGTGLGRLTPSFEPADTDGWISQELDSVLGADQVGELPHATDEDLRQVADRLVGLERRVSQQRKELHDRVDVLQAEIVRRYKTGEATVETLLR